MNPHHQRIIVRATIWGEPAHALRYVVCQGAATTTLRMRAKLSDDGVRTTMTDGQRSPQTADAWNG